MRRILLLFAFVGLFPALCIGQNNTKECNPSESIDELYGILYRSDKDTYEQSHKYIAADTLWMDSIKFVYYPNGAVCYEQWFLKGKCVIQRQYYSNGQIFTQQIDRKHGVTSKTESFPINYGRYCYLYGFKAYRRTNIVYYCDGTPWDIEFLGIYHNKKVRILIQFLSYNSQHLLTSAWIYKKNGILYQQFDWDETTQTWARPAVNHVHKRSYRKPKKEIIII